MKEIFSLTASVLKIINDPMAKAGPADRINFATAYLEKMIAGLNESAPKEKVAKAYLIVANNFLRSKYSTADPDILLNQATAILEDALIKIDFETYKTWEKDKQALLAIN